MATPPADMLKQSIQPAGCNECITVKSTTVYSYRDIIYSNINDYRAAKLEDLLQSSLSHRKDAKELIVSLLAILTPNIQNLSQIPDHHTKCVYKSCDGKFFNTDKERIDHEVNIKPKDGQPKIPTPVDVK
jgi:hypothetical protein